MFKDLLKVIMPNGCPSCNSQLLVVELNWRSKVVDSFSAPFAIADSYCEILLRCSKCSTEITHKRNSCDMPNVKI